MDFATTYLILAIVFGFFMAWGIGANDVANAMGTSVGSRALTIVQAVIIAAIFESAGALLAGGEVTTTIKSGIIDPAMFDGHPDVLVYGMLASLLAAGTWLLVACYFGWPVSTTHSIVGSLIGVGVVAVSADAVRWSEIVAIMGSWVITPFISGLIAFFTFSSIQRFIFNQPNPVESAKRYLPIYVFIVTLAISLVTFIKGLTHTGLTWSLETRIISSFIFSILIALLSKVLLSRVKSDPHDDDNFHFTRLEKLFGILMIFTACSMAFSHGSNDVANAIGPVSAIVSILNTSGGVASKVAVPFWVLLLGAVGIVTGLAMYGYRVIATIGKHITEMTPSRGFSAELATVITVIVASGTGLPISTTQTLVGAVLGVGMARGIGALNMNVIRGIFLSWAVTLPVGAGLAIVFYYLLAGIFSII